MKEVIFSANQFIEFIAAYGKIKYYSENENHLVSVPNAVNYFINKQLLTNNRNFEGL